MLLRCTFVNALYGISNHAQTHAFRTFRPERSSPQSLLGELWKDECSLVNLAAVVFEELLLFLLTNRSQWLLDIAAAILGADHESDLTAWVGRNGGPAILGDWEDLLARLFEIDNHTQVKPWVLGYSLRLASQWTYHLAPDGRERAYNLGW